MPTSSISAQQFAQRLKQEPALFCVDLRTPAEFRAEQLPKSINLPLGEFSEDTASLQQWPSNEPVYLLCATGKRAQKAQQQLNNERHTLIYVEGGLSACAEQGVTLVRQAGVISLERQVRIAAGTLVLTGVAIGTLLHPAGFALSGFVGAGLIFAGITDTCGMALLLAKMPWNR